MVSKPPQVNHGSLAELNMLFDSLVNDEYSAFLRPLDNDLHYLDYASFKTRVPSHLSAETAWIMTRRARQQHSINVFPVFCNDRKQSYSASHIAQSGPSHRMMVTPRIQHCLSNIDRFTSKDAVSLLLMNPALLNADNVRESLLSRWRREAIYSVQLDHADMDCAAVEHFLQTDKEAESDIEHLALQVMNLHEAVWEAKSQPFSVELLCQLATLLSPNADDQETVLRQSGSELVNFEDTTHVHHGAKAGEIEPRISQLAEWINLPHDDIDAGSYLHPLIKSIALHFCIGFIRPLGSKNGCLARALFYWCMYRHGYDAFRYISLSEMLLKNKSQYWRSFISTEDDHLDLTYFAEHQCEILVQAIADFVGFRVELEKFSPLNSELPFDIPKTSQGRSSSDNDNTKAESEVGLDVEVAEQAKETVPADVDLSTLSDQALSVIELAKSREDSDLTAKLVAEQCSVTEAVARAILNELTDKSLFSRERVKRQYVYSLLDN